MSRIPFCTLLLQIKLLLYKNFKLKTRRWKEIVLMICFAVFSMLLIGVFRSDVETQIIPSYHPSPQTFYQHLLASHGKMAIINKLPNTDMNARKIQTLQSSLQEWFTTNNNNLNIITNITSDSQLDQIIQTQNNDTTLDSMNHIKVAIDINKWDETAYDYTIRLPSSSVPSSSGSLIKSDKEISTSALTESLGLGHSYSNQFIPLQIWMDRFFLTYIAQKGDYNASITDLLNIKIQYQAFWTKQHEDDPFMDSMGSLLPFYIVSCFLLPFSYMIKDIVEEKSNKIKEGMRTMGLHILSFWMSWFITYLCLISLVASIVVFIQWKTSMFTHTSFALLYVLYLLYGLSIITFASAMTTFFDKPKTASTVSGFTYFLLQMPSYAIKSHLDTVGLGTKMLFSLSSPTGMFLSLLSIVDLEQNGKGYTFDNLFDENIVPAIQNGYCLGYSMVMLMLDIVLYGVFTWFLDQYIRSEYGQKLSVKQLFNQIICCCKLDERSRGLGRRDSFAYKPLSKHHRHSLMSDDHESSDNVLLSPTDIEMDAINATTHTNAYDNESSEIHQNVSIQITNLSKTYQGNSASSKSVRAVNNLSMDIYEGECCALLGTNGAGKTTTINMLTGMIDTTSGTATINGYNINHEMNSIRQFLGVCPQHCLLWPMLTVYEHLYLFANLKNMNAGSIQHEIDVLLRDVGLSEKKNCYASTLSGGQRRKLSLSIAFIGDPKVIFLDEPTSGMDPVSRRYTWDLIEKYKENRCIVLTTHDMNEADCIADRIAIMAHGRLRIYGSALYLKSVCGVGYNLIFTIDCQHFNADDMKSHMDTFTKTMNGFIKHTVLLSDSEKYGHKMDAVAPKSIEITFKTAIRDSRKFPSLFEHIDTHLKELRILHYAVSVTTLEEVFLKIAGDDDPYFEPKIQSNYDYTKSYDSATMDAETFISHSLTLSSSIPTERNNVSSKMDELRIDQDVIDTLCRFQRPQLSLYQRQKVHICSLLKKRLLVSIRDLRGIITQCVMPLISLLFGLSLVKSFDSVSTSQPSLDIVTRMYQTPFTMPYHNDDVNIVSFVSSDVQILQIEDIESITDLNEWILNETYKDYPYNLDTLYGALYLNSDDFTITLLHDSAATHLLPAMVNAWNEAIFSRMRQDDDSNMRVSSHPFPLSSQEVAMVDFGVTLMTVILISLSYAFIPTSFASYIVTERVSRVKHQQIIAGLSIVSYWISNLLFDLIIFMIPCVMGAIVIVLFDIKLFSSNVESLSIFLVFLLFGVSVITLTYLLSFLFSNAQSAQTILGRMYEISGLIFLIIGIMMSQFIPNGRYLLCDILLFLFRLFPNYAFGEGLFNITYAQQKANMIQSLLSDESQQQHMNVFKWKILGRDLCFMLSTTICNLILIFLVEYVRFNAKLMSYFASKVSIANDSNVDHQFEQDTDIIREKESIQNGEAMHTSSIKIMGLNKIFKSKKNNNIAKIAVSDLYFAVSDCEIFGFLGSNGAGKTTTLRMLTKELIPSDGNAYFANKYGLNNNIIDTNYYTFFYESQMGYCPQNDGLIELLTGREHLELYCKIRGFDGANCAQFVDMLISSLNLTQFSNNSVNSYSGGNRRKLCVGIALIGNPLIVMLDEPSTGIDPISRRFMWNFISNITRNDAQKRSVLLTTHSMEEAESLCDRIGIMDKGKLQCLGTAQHLKRKYGDGYELYIKLKENFKQKTKHNLTQYVLQNVRKELQQYVPHINIKLIDEHNVILRFSIRKNTTHRDRDVGDDDDIPLSKVFACIECIKHKYQIIEYSISQNTLEQVFLHLVDEEEEQDSNHSNQTNSMCCSCPCSS